MTWQQSVYGVSVLGVSVSRYMVTSAEGDFAGAKGDGVKGDGVKGDFAEGDGVNLLRHHDLAAIGLRCFSSQRLGFSEIGSRFSASQYLSNL